MALNKNWKTTSKNRYFVYEGDVLRAAQPIKAGAMKFMKPGRVLRKSPKSGAFK